MHVIMTRVIIPVGSGCVLFDSCLTLSLLLFSNMPLCCNSNNYYTEIPRSHLSIGGM